MSDFRGAGLQDFLGNEYGPGDLVMYAAMSGRCANMIIGRVEAIVRSFKDPDTYRWKALKDGEEAPFARRYGWLDANGEFQCTGRDIEAKDARERGLKWDEYVTDELVETKVTVRIMPLKGARWDQHRGTDYYIDTRSGAKIDPYRNSSCWASGGYYIDTRTGQRIEDQRYLTSWSAAYVDWQYRKHIPIVFHPWVERRNTGVKAVSLSVTDNIVRWLGELPPEVETALPHEDHRTSRQ